MVHFPVEERYRGFVDVSMRRWLGIRKPGLGATNMGVHDVAERANNWIWIKKDDDSWLE